MDLEREGNLIEAGVWFALSLALLIHSLRAEERVRPTLFLLVVTIVIFGASDLIEARTGAWWRPWWLFVWKALCVMLLLFGFVRYYRISKSKPRKNADEERR
jgi:hypothetical protein